MRRILLLIAIILCLQTSFALAEDRRATGAMYVYMLDAKQSKAGYDETLAVGCVQGIINRAARDAGDSRGPVLYVLSARNKRPAQWLTLLSENGRWLAGYQRQPVASLGDLLTLAGDRVKGAVIWDPAVPATVNVATTIAGVEDAVVFSPELYEQIAVPMKIKVVADLRGKFRDTKDATAKNQAYRWAIEEYLTKGLCSSKLLCLFEDSFSARAKGDTGYVVTRDWAVMNRAFVFDLSPWEDEAPGDDPKQTPGEDLATYKMILEEVMKQPGGKHMTEMTGFFAFDKYSHTEAHASRHEGVPTEWETVWLISPYNVYQNTISSDCFNQSLHSQAPRKALSQKARSPEVELANKSYVCVLMADYDSATPLYEFLPKDWADPRRGQIPLAWGINPNLLDTYPDLIAYYYETATAADTFTSDASCAGYMNPDRIRPENLPLFVRHNRKFFREADMTMAPMVLDQHEPSAAVKDAFAQFAPDGLASYVDDMHHTGGKFPEPQVWKGMPVIDLLNDTCNAGGNPDATASIMARVINARRQQSGVPGFYLFRCVWVSPGNIIDSIALLKKNHPELDVEVVSPGTFFHLFKESQKASEH